jgi:tetratricopeptide (TPR) repeat protein
MIPMYGQERVAHALADEACHHEGERRKAWIDGYREIFADAACTWENLERLRQATPESFLVLPESADIARKFVSALPKLKVKEQKQEIEILDNEAAEAYKRGDFQSAINQLDVLLSRFGDNDDPSLRKTIARALFNKGHTLESLDRHEEAIAVYDELILRFGEADDPVLCEGVARGLFNKGVALDELKRMEEAIGVYDDLIRRFGEADDPALRERVACALCKKSIALKKLGRGEEEIAVHDDLLRRFAATSDPALRKPVACALNLRAWSVYAKRNNSMVGQAILDAKKALEIDPQNAYRHTLASLFALASRWEDAFDQARLFANDDLLLSQSPDDVIEFLVYAASSGKAEEALRAIKGTKAESAMEPLVVALKMAAGKPFRAPQEVVEVAKDVLKRIEERARMSEIKPS